MSPYYVILYIPTTNNRLYMLSFTYSEHDNEKLISLLDGELCFIRPGRN